MRSGRRRRRLRGHQRHHVPDAAVAAQARWRWSTTSTASSTSASSALGMAARRAVLERPAAAVPAHAVPTIARPLDLIRTGSRRAHHRGVPRRGGRGLPPPPPLARAAAGLRGAAQGLQRIEIILDVLEAIPGAQLDVVGDGDHRENLEAEIARRGLGERVTMHGYVTEERKAELYGRAWVSMTASSSEGWSLTVMEAARDAERRDRDRRAARVGHRRRDRRAGARRGRAQAPRASDRRAARAARAPGRRRAARPHVHLGPLRAPTSACCSSGGPRARPRPRWRPPPTPTTSPTTMSRAAEVGRG